MAKIPTYQRKEISTVGDVAFAQGIGEIGKALTEIGQKFRQVQQEEEINRATIAYNDGKNQIDIEALKDPEPIGLTDRYVQSLNKLRNNVSNTFKDGEAQREFIRRVDVDISNYTAKLQRYEWDETIRKGRATLNDKLTQLQKLYIQETDVNLKKQHWVEMQLSLEVAKQQKLIYPDEAGETWRKIKENLPKRQALMDIANNPQYALDEAKKRKKGEYKDLALDEIVEIREKAETALINQQTKDKKIELQGRVSERFDYIGKIANGEITPENSPFIVGEIAAKDPELAEAVKKIFESKTTYIVNEWNNQAFQDLAQDIFLANDTETISKFLIKALTDKENISQDRLSILVDAAKLRANELPLSADKKQKKSKPSFTKAAFEAIKTYTSFASVPFVLMNTIVRAKTENVQNERIIGIANEEILKQRIIDDSTIALISKKGELRQDKFGTKFIQYPDGSIELVQTKTGQFIHKETRKKE